MRVRAKNLRPEDVPPEVERYIRQIFVAPGNNYDVHCIVVFDGIVHLQIVDDMGYPAWYASVLFDLVDKSVPDDWECNLLPGTDMNKRLMLLGPEFIVKDEASYEAMVELDADQVDRFWKRVDSQSGQTDDLGTPLDE